MRVAILIACALVCAVPRVASGANAPAVDRFASLPAGTVPALPTAQVTAPFDDGWVDGIVVRRPYKRGAVYVQATDGRCLVAVQGEANERPTQSTIYFNARQSMLVARSEKLVRDTNGARLVVSDVFVDGHSFSVREAERATIPLTVIAAHASGFTAYGFKDGDAVEIVATTNGNFQFTSEAAPELDTNDCGHARVRLDVAAAGGDSVVVVGTYVPVELPRTLAPRADEVAEDPRMWAVQLGASVSRTKSDAQPVASLALRVSETTMDSRGRQRM